jgi:hypothetical protein
MDGSSRVLFLLITYLRSTVPENLPLLGILDRTVVNAVSRSTNVGYELFSVLSP